MAACRHCSDHSADHDGRAADDRPFHRAARLRDRARHRLDQPGGGDRAVRLGPSAAGVRCFRRPLRPGPGDHVRRDHAGDRHRRDAVRAFGMGADRGARHRQRFRRRCWQPVDPDWLGDAAPARRAPIVQAVILGFGWVAAMLGVAGATLLTLPLAFAMRRRKTPAAEATPGTATATAEPGLSLGQQLKIAVADRSYWLLHLGFFTCGFHVAFLVTHLPGEVRLCGLSPTIAANSLAIIGLANVAGSLGVGWLGTRHRMKHLLFWIYLLRAASVLAYMAAPKMAATFYVFALALGLTWLATLPPTAGIVGKLFGVRYLATLLGVRLAIRSEERRVGKECRS